MSVVGVETTTTVAELNVAIPSAVPDRGSWLMSTFVAKRPERPRAWTAPLTQPGNA